MSAQKNSGLKAQLESILFAAGKAVSIQDLQKLCKEKSDKIRAALGELSKDYNEHDSSLMLVEEGESYKLTVREQYLPLVKDVVSETELPKSIMETLAVIAFKHPILQSELVKIRSNKAYDHLNELEQTGYIKREAYGRTRKIHLTQKFFDYFDLPPNKVKEAFASFEAVSKEIEKQEDLLDEEMQKIQEQRAEEKKAAEDKVGNLEVYDAEPEEDQEEKPLELQIYDTNTEPMGNVEVIRGEDVVKQPELPLDSATHEVIEGEPEDLEEDSDEDLVYDTDEDSDDDTDEDSGQDSSSEDSDEDSVDVADDDSEKPVGGLEEDSDDDSVDVADDDTDEDSGPDSSSDDLEEDSDEDSKKTVEGSEQDVNLSDDLEEDLNNKFSDGKDAEGDELLEKRIKEKEEALLGKKSEDKPNKCDEEFDSISQDIEEQKDVLGK